MLTVAVRLAAGLHGRRKAAAGVGAGVKVNDGDMVSRDHGHLVRWWQLVEQGAAHERLPCPPEEEAVEWGRFFFSTGGV